MVEPTKPEEKPKRKSRGRGRSAAQISLPSGHWAVADECVDKGMFKDRSQLFQIAFEKLMEEKGMSLTIRIEEVGSQRKR